MKQQDTGKPATQSKSKKFVSPSSSSPNNGSKPKQAKQPPSLSPIPSPKLSPDVDNDVRNGVKPKRRVPVSRTNNIPKSLKEAPRMKGSEKDGILGISSKNAQVVEFAKPTRRPRVNSTRNQSDNGLLEKLSRSESLVANLQAEVLDLKAELDRAQSRNKILAEDLAAANARIDSLEAHEKAHPAKEQQSPNFKAMQLLIATKLKQPRVRSEPIIEAHVEQPMQNPVVQGNIAEIVSSMRPPPPPPPPPRAIATRKASSVEELYHSLSKRAIKQNSPKNGNFNKPCVSTAHSSIVGEIQNRSSHLLAIKLDIETKGEFINGLIGKVLDASFTDIEDVASFVAWLDSELLCLADERAVLRHFKWPEKKADAMREAAIEYRSLKILETEVSSYKDDTSIPYGVALKKMASLLDKSERSIQRLTTLRNSVMRSYQDHQVPTDWLLDSGFVCKIKMGSRELAKKYVERLMMELQSIRHSEREFAQETLLLQGVHFAYKAQQIAGGLDSETLCAFEEMRQLVPPGNLRVSQELLLTCIPSS